MKNFEIDGVKYELRDEFDFLERRELCFKALALFKDVVTVENLSNINDIKIDISAICSNLAQDENASLEAIQNYILRHAQVVKDGKTLLLKDNKNLNEHFSNFPEHYLTVIVEGIKHYFLPLFKGIAGFVQPIAN